ncbi:MAG: hypothetical protein LBJ73_05315 [Rickettsiales bacterium]|jgi:hypothetical protein|nr:hypothetical protein [Rickettsiales bacterium]
MEKKSNGPMILLIILIAVIAVLAWVLITRPGDRPRAGDIDSDTPAVSNSDGEFNDGLGAPISRTTYPLDEFGEGVAAADAFDVDINKDSRPDRITRTLTETGADHFYYDYKIELDMGGYYANITPANFRTVEGAECALKKLKFVFRPNFQVIVISREWQESWTTPTPASRTIYKLENNELKAGEARRLKTVCDVSGLF